GAGQAQHERKSQNSLFHRLPSVKCFLLWVRDVFALVKPHISCIFHASNASHSRARQRVSKACRRVCEGNISVM
ncbi:MAG: hypothetical protein E6559_23120, partial [Pantoea sp.]|nr:hypothetical protein [Pantoea sp.]